MLPLHRLEQYSLHTAGLTGSILNSTFARYRSAETATEERMRRQREARLQQPHTDLLHSTELPFIRSMRFPQRWTDEE
jgi:hypothetical protein